MLPTFFSQHFLGVKYVFWHFVLTQFILRIQNSSNRLVLFWVNCDLWEN
jgi:hypothetical protein